MQPCELPRKLLSHQNPANSTRSMNAEDISEIVTLSGCGMKHVSGLGDTKPSHQAASLSSLVYVIESQNGLCWKGP